nr:MAG TPA: hypothetical protein [Caudoviricetes sp.]
MYLLFLRMGYFLSVIFKEILMRSSGMMPTWTFLHKTTIC